GLRWRFPSASGGGFNRPQVAISVGLGWRLRSASGGDFGRPVQAPPGPLWRVISGGAERGAAGAPPWGSGAAFAAPRVAVGHVILGSRGPRLSAGSTSFGCGFGARRWRDGGLFWPG